MKKTYNSSPKLGPVQHKKFPLILLEKDEILQHFKCGIWYKNLVINRDIAKYYNNIYKWFCRIINDF